MLQSINDRATSWVAYVIIGLIVFSFALFGIGSYLGGSDALVAAKVNGQEILANQVQSTVVSLRQRGQDDPALKEKVVEAAVNDVILSQQAEENGFRASNQEVYDWISTNPDFQREGKFDPAAYESLLSMSGRSKASYESSIRTMLSNQQLTRSIADTAFLPKSNIEQFQKIQNQTRSIETYTFKMSDFESGVTVSEEEVKSYYDANLSQFMTKEKAKLAVVALNQGDFEAKVEIASDTLQAIYDDNLDRYIEPEQRKLAHILIKLNEGASEEEAIKIAQEKAKTLYDDIIAEKITFEEAASTISEDKIAAEKSGEMGVLTKGDMGPAFELVAFSLEKGKISEPVKTEAGVEIIKLLDITPSKQKEFSAVKEQIEREYREEEAEKIFTNDSEKLETLAFENDDSLDFVAESLETKIIESDWVERSGVTSSDSDELFKSPKLISMAFGEDVLLKGKNSELVEVDSETVAIVRVLEHEVPQQKVLADVTEDIKAILSVQKTRKLVIDKGEQTLKTLQSGGGWDSISDTIGSIDKLSKSENIKRSNSELARELVDKAFSMGKPSGDKSLFSNVVLPSGDYVLVGLNEVKDGAVDSAEGDVLQSILVGAYGSTEQGALVKSLREKATVELFLENVE